MGDTARYIEAPEIWNGEGASVFLAGGITGCPDWQQEARRMFRNLDVTVINPRRADFPIGDPTAAPAQIAWEFDHLHRATAILFWFPVSEGPQPIALYELGRYLALGRPLAVGCDPAYPRRQDVIEQVGLATQDMPVWGNLSATCLAAGAAVESAYRAGQAATPDGPQPDPKRTPEAAAEILARELYIVGHITADDRAAREGWYRLASEGARDGWRDDARRLLASLRESDLALTWLIDVTPAADGQDGDGRG